MKVRQRASNECWEWLASTDGKGYGKFKYNGRYEGAHRVAYRLAVGPIPIAKLVMHVCDNRPCCNPTHLRLGTQSDNIHDAMSKGRFTGGRIKHGRYIGKWAYYHNRGIHEETTATAEDNAALDADELRSGDLQD